jgi:hypothetical protein
MPDRRYAIQSIGFASTLPSAGHLAILKGDRPWQTRET